jgi:hypothetical protein
MTHRAPKSTEVPTGLQPPIVWLPAALRAIARKIEERHTGGSK